jgi:tetratricopeptide (TPR) repeat protein
MDKGMRKECVENDAHCVSGLRGAGRRLIGGLQACARIVGMALVLPVDCAFLMWDVFAVNLQKSRFFDQDCRGPLGGTDSLCPAATKYTNTWLFRLVCPETRKVDGIPFPACDAGGELRPYPLRAAITVVCLLIGGVLTGAGLWWTLTYERAADENGPAITSELVARRRLTADRAMEEGRFGAALDFYLKILRVQPDDKKAFYRAGLCLEKMGRGDSAIAYWLQAAEGKGALPPAMQKLALQFYKRANVRMAGLYAQRFLKTEEGTAPLTAIAAESYILENDQETAKSLLERAERMDPDNDVVVLARGHQLAVAGDYERADTFLSKPGNFSPFYPLALLYQGELLWRRGDVQSGIARLRQLVAMYPDLHGARVLFVRTLLAVGRDQRALLEVERSRRDLPYSFSMQLSMAYLLRDHGFADRSLDLAYDLLERPATAVPASLLSAEILMNRGLPRRAKPHVKHVLELAPENVTAILAAARIARATGDAHEANVLLVRAASMSPDDPEISAERGRVQVQLGRVEEALQHLRRARDLQPKAGKYHYEYGAALLRAGRGEEGKAELMEAARLGHDPCRVYTRLGMWERTVGRDREAIEHYFKAVSAAPHRAVTASNDLAAMMLDTGENPPLALALAYFAHLNADSPALAAHTADTLAEALVKTGNAARAVSLARQAVAARPEDQERLVRLAMAEAAAGEKERAVEALERAVRLAPRSDSGQRAQQFLHSLRETAGHAPSGGAAPD